ncbi:MAG: DUF3048 domain-containing protein [Anaerolineales bacterium]
MLLCLIMLTVYSACAPQAGNENLPPSNNMTLSSGVTSTPFQPGDDLNSPYFVPTTTPTPGGSAGAIGTLIVDQFNRPTPLPYMPGQSTVVPPAPEVNPLTGLAPADPSLLERRPLAIKITLFPRYVRPQSGLSLADVVFEYYIEDGLTRFIAVFYGNDAELVGPVRSGRFFDEHVARMYQAFFVFKYADPRAYDYFKETDLADYLVVPGVGACPPFVVGKSDRDTYNNIFFNTFKFKDCIARREGVDNLRPNLRSGFFGDLPPKPDGSAARIYLHYSPDDYSYWEYLPEAQRYQRYQETLSTRDGESEAYAPLFDDLTGSPIMADNVVVFFVEHKFVNQFDEEDEVYHIDVYGGGPAYIFRNGLVKKGFWQRTDLNQPLLLTDENNAPIYLKPGITFYQVMGLASSASHTENEWYFRFETP